jgi:hypothetical protein
MLFNVLKWINEMRDNIYIQNMEEHHLYLEDVLEDAVIENRGGKLPYICRNEH